MPLARRGLVAAVLLLVPGFAGAQEADTLTPFQRIPWENGPVLGSLGAEAEVNVPEGCLFTGAEGTKQFMELSQNPVNGRERGTVLCDVPGGGEEGGSWFVVFEYDDSGYVKDDEKSALDADAILATMREGTARGNEERAKRGWSTLTIDGWARAPYYDSSTNNLTWAMTLSASDGNKVLNHSVRLLGRGGVMSADLVVSPEEYEASLPAFDAVLADFRYKAGHTYAEWRKGDKLAAYGLTALVAGGAGVALAKSGLLQKFGKVLIAGLVAVIAGVRKFLFGKKDAGTAA